MKLEFRNCEDRDRGSEDCSLMPRFPKLILSIRAGIQALDEREPMMPFEVVALEAKYQDGDTPR